ncbi:MAG: carboxypeptidase-like regulatory domain-containing protein [Clostridiales bacterium]|jgi:hypothetical protein|nr:carboxypeptidase-like regulatory domain-containing protein [Clostridiales bacterium]
MKEYIKKLSVKPYLSAALTIILILALFFIGNNPLKEFISMQIEAFNPADTQKDKEHYTSIRPRVIDGFSEMPIEGAVVVIPELNQSYFTSEDGLTERIELPVLKDKNFEKIAPKPYGEITLIVYKEGYVEYILLHTQVWETINREGPEILLFPRVQDGYNETFTVVENPHRIWVQDLVEKFRP